MRSNVSSHNSSYPLILHYSLLKSLEIVSTFLRLFFSITFSLLFLCFFLSSYIQAAQMLALKKELAKLKKSGTTIKNGGGGLGKNQMVSMQ